MAKDQTRVFRKHLGTLGYMRPRCLSQSNSKRRSLQNFSLPDPCFRVRPDYETQLLRTAGLACLLNVQLFYQVSEKARVRNTIWLMLLQPPCYGIHGDMRGGSLRS